MDKGKKTAVIFLCILAIAAILMFTKADVNHGHGPQEHGVTQIAH